jgi:hypothetical protein
MHGNFGTRIELLHQIVQSHFLYKLPTSNRRLGGSESHTERVYTCVRVTIRYDAVLGGYSAEPSKKTVLYTRWSHHR